jgi:hypothetical protein
MATSERQPGCATWLVILMLAAVLGYVPSSGPVLAVAFWLRDQTGIDGFYAVMWLYYPLLILGRDSPLEAYWLWWTSLFGTAFPG